MGLFNDKTEAATPKRREDAKKKGQLAKSRDLLSVVVLIAGLNAIRAVWPHAVATCREDLVFYFTDALRPDRMDAIGQAPAKLVGQVGAILGPLFVAVMTAGVVGNVAQTGPLLISDPLKVNMSKMNPLQGLQRMASPQALGEMVKAMLKVTLVAWVTYGWMRTNYPKLLELADMDLLQGTQFAGSKAVELTSRIVSVLVMIATGDYAWQRFQHEMSLRMTKQEIREEMRSQEGSPEIKGAIRRKQREIARRRMMNDVVHADVVITNPTHYAVALRYDPITMDAPEVVALGQRLVALRIRELAKEHDIPIVENPPLARALFAACDVGSQVPSELYAAVAEVLAYVYRLSGKGLPSR